MAAGYRTKIMNLVLINFMWDVRGVICARNEIEKKGQR